MRKRLIIPINIILLLTNYSYSQHLGAYVDHMNHFYIFDRGQSIKIEDLKPQSYKVGGEMVLYKDSAGRLKMYYNGTVSRIEKGNFSIHKYSATDHLGVYRLLNKLKVIYKGEIIQLSSSCTGYLVQDSLIAYYDKNQESLRVFYKGKIHDIESGLLGFPIQYWSSGDNIVAYISGRTKDFKIWHRGKIQTIITNAEETFFKSGKDIVAYVDPIERNFKAYYKGEVCVLNDFIPESFKVGDMFVAFVDHMGEFKIFENGEIKLVSTGTPEKYLAKDNTLIYIEDDRFYGWYDNKPIEIEAWVPNVFEIDWNTVAYLDNTNRIWIYQNGKRKYISNELVNSFNLYRDVIHMNIKVNHNLIYYQDKFYEGNSYYK